MINWDQAATLGIPAIVVIASWFSAHWLNTKRDVETRRHEARVKALEAAYMRIATSMNRPLSPEVVHSLETFVAEIQLYGTPHQVVLMSEIVKEFTKPNNIVYYDAMLENLRDTIRDELRFEPVSGPVWWLRLPGPPDSPSKGNEPLQQDRA